MCQTLFIVVALCACATARLDWSGPSTWRQTWNFTSQPEKSLNIPNNSEWERIGKFYTYGPRYMLQQRTKEQPDGSKKLEYFIHFHVDVHADTKLTGEEYDLQKYGYARVFGTDHAKATSFINHATGHHFANFDEVKACGSSSDCDFAISPDPKLYDQNASIVNVLHAIPAPLTVRCHDHDNGIWCHNRVQEFNQGSFYVVEVEPDNEPGVRRQAAVMCHDWPHSLTDTSLNPPHCHSTPIGGVVTFVSKKNWDTAGNLPSAQMWQLQQLGVGFDVDKDEIKKPTQAEQQQFADLKRAPDASVLKAVDGKAQIAWHADRRSDAVLRGEVKALAQHGYARLFNDVSVATHFMSHASGWSFADWGELKACARDTSCSKAWTVDNALLNKDTTVVNVLHAIPATLTVRCHATDDGIWCHNRVEEVNKGVFYVVQAVTKEEPGVRRVGTILCDSWYGPGVTCHSTPVGAMVAVVKSDRWDVLEELPTLDKLLNTTARHKDMKHMEKKNGGEKVEMFNGRINYRRLHWPGADEWRSTW